MHFDWYDFTGKVGIVTGGGTGIGAATAQLLARLGADVVIAGRKQERLEIKAREIRDATGRQCLVVPTDVRNEDEVKHLVDATHTHFGRLDMLVNNAGGTFPYPLEDVTTQQWQRNFALNVDAAYYCTREAGKFFREQRSGGIVNVSSLAGVNGTKNCAPYSAAKSALQMFTRVAAAEWGPYGIRINCVAPGMIVTELTPDHSKLVKIDMKDALAHFPLRRTGKPEEVASAIAFFLSEAAAYITGETLCVGGGPQMGGTG
jgi:citronellol/citronellal dehydrogenase